MFCNTCWTNLPDGTQKCPKCGGDPRAGTTPLSADKKRTVQRTVRPGPARSSSAVSPVFPALAILLIISGSVYYLYQGTPDDKGSQGLGVKEPAEITTFKKIEDYTPRASKKEIRIVERSRVLSDNPKEIDEAAAAFNKGEYRRSTELLRSALRDSPDSMEIKAFLSKSMNNLALEEYRRGNYLRSKGLLEEAIELKSDPAVFKNLAKVQIKLDDLEGALETIEHHSADPEARDLLKFIYKKLGEINLRDGRVDRALVFFEKSLQLDPTDVVVKKAAEKLRAEVDVERGFRTKKGSHFLVKFEGGENAEAGHLIGLILEEAYIKVGSELGFHPKDNIGAVLYSGQQFHDITRSPSWAGAIYDGRIKIPTGGITERTELLTEVIFHEYTHAVVHRVSGGRAPTWLNEGIAQYEEGKRTDRYRDVLRKIAVNNKVSLRAMEGSFMGLNPNQATAVYLLSLSATEYIVREFGVFSVMRILEGLAKGLSLERAIKNTLYLSYEDLERSWLASLKR